MNIYLCRGSEINHYDNNDDIKDDDICLLINGDFFASWGNNQVPEILRTAMDDEKSKSWLNMLMIHVANDAFKKGVSYSQKEIKKVLGL